MVNYKDREQFLKNPNKGEIIFANHKLEFLRFFEAHKKLCDEISGLKYHTINNINGGSQVVIKMNNFNLAINKLGAFITDFFHYINEPTQTKNILTQFNKLEERFNEDTEYQSLISKKNDMSITQEVRLNELYIKYLIECFEIAHLMSKYLQKSLNIASKEIMKTIHFVDYDGFFNNLSHYRDETVSDLSNIKYETLFDNYKKLMGYFYTYRYLINVSNDIIIMEGLNKLYEYIIHTDTVKFIIKVREGGDITNTTKEIMKNEFKSVKRLFKGIYILCNSSLKDKNILPKNKTEILEDNTLI